jgi:hypothetical protein
MHEGATKLQAATLASLEACGAVIAVVHSLAEAQRIIRDTLGED